MTETTSQRQAAPPCQGRQQLGDALPRLAVALAIVVALNRVERRRKKLDEQADGTGDGGAVKGDKI